MYEITVNTTTIARFDGSLIAKPTSSTAVTNNVNPVENGYPKARYGRGKSGAVMRNFISDANANPVTIIIINTEIPNSVSNELPKISTSAKK